MGSPVGLGLSAAQRIQHATRETSLTYQEILARRWNQSAVRGAMQKCAKSVCVYRACREICFFGFEVGAGQKTLKFQGDPLVFLPI